MSLYIVLSSCTLNQFHTEISHFSASQNPVVRPQKWPDTIENIPDGYFYIGAAVGRAFQCQEVIPTYLGIPRHCVCVCVLYDRRLRCSFAVAKTHARFGSQTRQPNKQQGLRSQIIRDKRLQDSFYSACKVRTVE